MWLKIKVWFKVTVAALLALYLLIFILKNTTQDVTFWYWFHRTQSTSVFVLALFAFVSGIIGAVVVRTTWKTVSQIRELRRRSREMRDRRDLAEMKSKAGMLKTRSSVAASAPAIREPRGFPVEPTASGAAHDPDEIA